MNTTQLTLSFSPTQKIEAKMPGWDFEQKQFVFKFERIRKKVTTQAKKQVKSVWRRVKIVIGAIIQLNLFKRLPEAIITAYKYLFENKELDLTDDDVLQSRKTNIQLSKQYGKTVKPNGKTVKPIKPIQFYSVPDSVIAF